MGQKYKNKMNTKGHIHYFKVLLLHVKNRLVELTSLAKYEVNMYQQALSKKNCVMKYQKE